MKKKISLLVIVFMLSKPLYAEVNTRLDTIPVLDTVPNNKIEDFSNRQYADVSSLLKDDSSMLASTIVVINNKIYRINAPAFKALNKNTIASLRIIKDEAADSAIKNIILIQTK